MSSTTHVLTLAEAMALPVDSLEEIVNGEIVRMPPPDKGHTRLIGALSRSLQRQLDEQRYEVITTASGLGIRRDPPIAVRNPDLSVYEIDDLIRDHEASAGTGYIWAAPRLVVECLSPNSRRGSLHQLLADYETARVAEVWLLNPRKRMAETLLLNDGVLSSEKTQSEGELVSSALGLSVSLDKLWRVFETGREQ